MNKPKSNTPPTPQSSTGSFWLLLILFLGFCAICALGKPQIRTYSIWNRTWGFDHITLYGTNAKLLFFFVCLVLLVPYTNGLIKTWITWLAEKLVRLRKQKILLFLLVSMGCAFLFYLLHVKYYFLGDFNLRMNQTMKKDFVATEYATMRLLYAFASTGMRFGYTTDELFRLYSYICGGFFVFISLLTANLAGKTPLHKLLFFFTLLSTSLILVFCGYVEVYATPLMLLALYLYFGLRYLKTGKGFILVIASLILAVVSHLLCLAAIPSLFVAWYFNNKRRVSFISTLSNKNTGIYLTILITLSLVVAFKIRSGFLLTVSPPAGSPKTMTLFASRHFWEFFNGQVLCCGLSVIFIFILLAKSIREKKPLLSEHYFLLGLSGCFFLLVFVANLQRGSGDWDIMAFPAISLNLTTILLITHLYKNRPVIAHYLMVAITGLNGVNTFLWLHINHTDKSIGKIEKMLVNDPGTYYTARIAGAVQLALAYSNNKLPQESKRAAWNACNAPGNEDTRPCVMYGFALKEEKKLDEARDYFMDLLTRAPFVYEAHMYLLEYYERTKDQVKFLYHLNKFYDAFAQKPDPFVDHLQFKPGIIIQLFEYLYQIELPKNDTARLQQMQKVIQALKVYKPAAKK